MEETDQAKDQGKYTKRVWDEMGQKTKSRKIKDDKWERKKKNRCKGDIVKDIIKIRLLLWGLIQNYYQRGRANIVLIIWKRE